MNHHLLAQGLIDEVDSPQNIKNLLGEYTPRPTTTITPSGDGISTTSVYAAIVIAVVLAIVIGVIASIFMKKKR